MNYYADDNRGFVSALVDDGRPLLKLTGLALIGSGLFAFFLGATGHFLPHDIDFLGSTAAELRQIADSRLVNFMIHDRVSFGGAILAVGVLYLWLAEFPLRRARLGMVDAPDQRHDWIRQFSGVSRLRLPRFVAWRRHACAAADLRASECTSRLRF